MYINICNIRFPSTLAAGTLIFTYICQSHGCRADLTPLHVSGDRQERGETPVRLSLRIITFQASTPAKLDPPQASEALSRDAEVHDSVLKPIERALGDLQETSEQSTAHSSDSSGPPSSPTKQSIQNDFDFGAQARIFLPEQIWAPEFSASQTARPSRSIINSSERSVIENQVFDNSLPEPRRRVVDPKRLESWIREASLELFGRDGLRKLRAGKSLHIEKGAVPGDSSEDKALLSFKHLTISRDQTAASDFERERLLALSDIPNSPDTDPALPPAAVSADSIYLRAAANNPIFYDPPLTAPVIIQTTESISTFRKYHVEPTFVIEAKSNNMEEEMEIVKDASRNIGLGNVEPRTPSPPVSVLKERIKQLEIEITDLRRAPSSAPKATPATTEPPVFLSLNYFVGSRTPFLGWPAWERTEGSKFVLKGSQPVGNLEALLHRKGNVAFVVEKWFHDSVMPNSKEIEKARKAGLDIPDAMPAFTRIVFISEEMKAGFTTFLQAAKNHFGEFQDYVTDQTLQSPYTFWYHCRKTPIVEGMPAKEQELLRLLTSWIEESYGEEYSEADDSFQKGVVKSPMVRYLIAPGELLTWRDSNHVVVFKAESWPRMKTPQAYSDSTYESEAGWVIDAWSYRYDGKFWKSYRQLNLYHTQPPKDDTETTISTLHAIPLRFQSEEQRRSLEARGRNFWKCRRKRFVSYQVEDADDQLSRVSIPIYPGARPDTDGQESSMNGT